MEKRKIGLAGFGFVGQALYGSIDLEKTEVAIYDPPKGFDDKKVLKDCEVIFCCLPTPSTVEGQNFDYYKDFLVEIGDTNTDAVLVIKSTVLFKHVSESALAKIRNVIMNPEFLNQNTYAEDFKNQKIIILGGRVDLARKVEEVYRTCFSFTADPRFEFCSIKEAIEVKYIHNIYHAYKVLFWNYVHEVTHNERKIFEMYIRVTEKDPRFEMAQLFADGRPGFGGACFPKDLWTFDSERPHTLTQFMKDYNFMLRGIKASDENCT